MSVKRIFLAVLDSFGAGELPDADKYGDAGSNTLRAVSSSKYFSAPNMTSLGLFNIKSDGVKKCGVKNPLGAFGKMAEKSNGKETTIGHWEISGAISETPLPYYPNGFPKEIIGEFERLTGRKTLCNLPYSGTRVIEDYGKEHLATGALIVYTSADSVFQIAAHEDVVPTEELYEICKTARKMLTGKNSVGRVIARPFTGTPGSFVRTAGRHDYALEVPKPTMLDLLKNAGFDTVAVGKINDIFSGRGISRYVPAPTNAEAMERTAELVSEKFNGLCFINLVEFDSLYGHRNNIDGYAKAVSDFDAWLGDFLPKLQADDVLIITADHGCDPATESTDHSREYVPLLIYGDKIKSADLGTRPTFADLGATVLDIFGINDLLDGNSFKTEILK